MSELSAYLSSSSSSSSLENSPPTRSPVFLASSVVLCFSSSLAFSLRRASSIFSYSDNIHQPISSLTHHWWSLKKELRFVVNTNLHKSWYVLMDHIRSTDLFLHRSLIRCLVLFRQPKKIMHRSRVSFVILHKE